jgi:phenylacetate-CoA ligase
MPVRVNPKEVRLQRGECNGVQIHSRSGAFRFLRLQRLNRLLAATWGCNPFYTRKWRKAGLRPERLGSLDRLAAFPFTTRSELVSDQAARPPLGTNLSCSLAEVKQLHRSSGTSLAPLLWGDTWESWQWVIRCSQSLYLLAGLSREDRVFFSLTLGTSSGPWILYEGAGALNCVRRTAGQTTPQRQLKRVETFRPNVVVGKPSQLLALALAAELAGHPPESLGVRKLIFTGEPSRNTLRSQLERLWAAECFDRYGLTEAGSVASECPAHSGGMHLLESEFIAEVISPKTGQPAGEGKLGELVLTNLGRLARPIIRYRTGDLVRLVRDHHCPCGRAEALLLGDVVRAHVQRPWSGEPGGVLALGKLEGARSGLCSRSTSFNASLRTNAVNSCSA